VTTGPGFCRLFVAWEPCDVDAPLA